MKGLKGETTEDRLKNRLLGNGAELKLEILRLLKFVLDNYPDKLDALTLGQSVSELARQNDKRAAFMTWQVYDEWVKNARGNEKLNDIFLLVKIDRDAYDRLNSRIIIGNEQR